MGDTIAEVEAAITEVTKARQAVMRRKALQVTAADEIDRLKSVVFAWFQTHRLHATSHPSRPDVTDADVAYRSVMEATERRTSRAKYAKSLLEAKQALVGIRSYVATTPDVTETSGAVAHVVDVPPDFTPLASDPRMQSILDRRWHEVQECAGGTAFLAATVMMGGLLESLLLARINTSPKISAVYTAKKAPRDKAGKTRPLSDWKLADMVEVAHELGWITRSSKDLGHVLRDFRNYIHPHKEHTDGVLITKDDVLIFWEVTKAVSRQVLGSVGRSP